MEIWLEVYGEGPCAGQKAWLHTEGGTRHFYMRWKFIDAHSSSTSQIACVKHIPHYGIEDYNRTLSSQFVVIGCSE